MTTKIAATKIDLNELLGDDARYVNSDSKIAIESFGLDGWAALLAGVIHLNGEDSIPGIDCEVCATRETLAEFDDSRARFWTDRGYARDLTIAGRPAKHYQAFQMQRGQTRHDMLVVDLGDRRAALSIGG